MNRRERFLRAVLGTPAPHQHTHRPVRVQHAKLPCMPPYGDNPPHLIDVTLVLYVCACGIAQTQQLTGTWTMDDVLGKTAGETVNELLAAAKGKPIA